jgi:predicted  nucleic acid-binding Zn-ribbon protein
MHPKRDEYLCSGCNMKVTLEVINALQTRDELQTCKVCGRILYWEAPEKQRARA